MCAFVVQSLWSMRRGGQETGWRRGGGSRRNRRAHPEPKAIREAEMDQVAAAAGERAVLAELRAIGLSFAASTGV